MSSQLIKNKRKIILILQLSVFACASLHINETIALDNKNHNLNNNTEIPLLRKVDPPPIINDPFQKVYEDLGIMPQDLIIPPEDYNILGKLRDNDNSYKQVWTPWLSRAAVHVAKVSDDGEFFVIGGGYLLDTELHIYRWNSDERSYIKVWEAGSGILNRDVYDVAFGDSDNNNLIEIAAACADGRVYLFEQAHISDPIANLENRFDFVWKSDNFFQATAVEFHDLDLDGDEDLVVGSWDKKLHIFECTDHSGYPFDIEHWLELTERWNSTELDEKIQSLDVGDYNDNGLPDIIVGTLSGSIYIFENDGTVMSPYGIEFPFPNDNDYRLIWNNSGLYQPIWNPIGQIATGELDDGDNATEAVIVAWGQGAWVLHYTDERGFYLEQLIQNFEGWQMTGAYPFDNFADWMVRGESMNWQVYYQHPNGSKYPEPWSFAAQNEFDPLSNSAVTGEPTHSEHGGVMYNGHEYRFFPTYRTWTQAKDDCEAQGGHLVTITSSDEKDSVSSLAGSNTVWLGFTDSETYGATEGNWQWITGESVTYTNWNSGEPNNAADEDFAQMYGNGYWNDLDPGYQRYYVCEWDGESTTFYANSTHKNATGTWNLGVGEELASNGNSDPDLYVIFDSGTVVLTDEWNISLSNNLVNWHQINNTEISPITTAGKGLAINVDPLFAKKKMMSTQYIRLTLLQGDATDFKERRVKAIVFPYVARPLTIAASVTIDPLSFSYGETEETTQNKIVFGGVDGRLIAFQYEPHNISYYKKSSGEEAKLTEIPATDHGIINPTFNQIWDSYTDAYFNLGETIWSIQGTPKKTYIPSWRYIKDGVDKTKEFDSVTSTWLENLHHLSIADITNDPGSELLVTRTDLQDLISVYNSDTGEETSFPDPVAPIEGYYSNEKKTLAFGELYQGGVKDDIVIFPWYSGAFRRPSTYDEKLLPALWKFQAGSYQIVPEILTDVDGHMFNFLSEAITFPSAAIVDVNNDSLQDIIISNGRLAILWNIGTNTSPSFKFDFDYFKELNERAPPNPIFSPNAWDYDRDGDYDIAYSYGQDSSGELRFGMDFFENQGTSSEPLWIRNAYVMKNPTTDGSLRYNNYTAGVIIPSDLAESTAESLWVWNGVDQHIRNLIAETDQQNSYIIGTNPELIKLEVNLKQSPPDAINFGYSIVKSWSNLEELDDWTLTLTTSYGLDGDSNAEIIVSDYDNNVYVFEHLTENTYKRAYRTQNLNHTETTNFSPYAFQDLPGVSGTFQRTIFDHGNLAAAGFDYNDNGNEEFIIAAGFKIYIFEATGFNDEFELVFESDYSNFIFDPDEYQFTTLATTPDFDGRGSMIALSVSNQIFLLRYDPVIGWVESFQSTGSGYYNQPGNPNYHPDLDIRAMLFADFNQDGKTELWIGGANLTGTETGFLLALQSDFGDIHQFYEFNQSISTHINAFATSDSDFDGKLELIIAHANGIDIWEAEKSASLNFTRTEIISSDPNYGSDNELAPTFDSYNSPVGLAPRAHDILRLDTGDYFVVYGVEEENHNSDGNQTMVNMSDPINGDGRLYYNVTSESTALGTVKNLTQQLFNTPEGLIISEIFYQDHPQDFNSSHWIELYNPNLFDINLTNWILGINDKNITIGTDIISARDYYVIARNSSVFNDSYGFYPDINNTSLEFPYPLSGFDKVTLYHASTEIDSVDLIQVSSSRQRLNQTNVLKTADIPLDTDSVFDWEERLWAAGPPYNNGTPGVRNYDSSDGIDFGIEYEPAVTQLHNGTIFVSWIHAYNTSDGSANGRCILARNLDESANPLTKTRLIANITNPTVYPNVQIRGLGAIEIYNGTDGIVYLSYTMYNSSLGFDGDLKLQVIQNGELSDKSSSLGLDDFFIHSVDLLNINGRLGIIFAGYPRNTFYLAQQLYLTILNSTYQNQGVFQITNDAVNAQFPSASTMENYQSRITILYERRYLDERLIGGKSDVVSIFSSDSGATWSDSYVLNSNDPYLVQTPAGLETESGNSVISRQNYRPCVTDDGTGGILYQFVSRFLVDNSDLNYIGNVYNSSHNLATQLWIGNIKQGHWFKFTDLHEVTAIAVGDTDNDLRNELFISHGYRVSLLELNQEPGGSVSYIQKWQYQPPSFISLHPELLNSTYAQFFASDGARAREIGTVAIFDGNGNGWPELIFSLRGGDVFSFEVTNLEQPINDMYAITEEYREVTFSSSTINASDNLLIDVNNDGELDLIVADGQGENGITAWDIEDDELLWNYTAQSKIGKIYFIDNSVIVGITSEGIFGVDLDGNEQYWINETSLNTTNNHAFTEVDSDAVPDLIVATMTDILAIEPISGEMIWDVKPDNNSQNKGYFDLAVGSIGKTTRISVCSSDFSTYKNVSILGKDGSILESFNLTHLTKFDTRSRSAIGDFDGDLQLDLAIAIFDNYSNKSHLEVYDLSTLSIMLNQTIPVAEGLDLDGFTIYARDVDDNSISDIILPIHDFTSSTSLFPSKGYTSAIFAIDVYTTSIIWQRYFLDSMAKFEIELYGNKEIILAYTSNSGLFAISLTGADILWTDLDSQSVAVSIANADNEQTYIAVTCINGAGPVFRVAGMLTKANNTITPQISFVETHTEILYTDLTSIDSSVIPVIVTKDGTEKLLIAFNNGTLILRSFDRGEIWRIQVLAFSNISACGLEIEPGRLGLAFKTDTSDLFILERTTTQVWTQISTDGSIVSSLSLDGSSDVLLLQTFVNNRGTLSIFNPITKTFTWTYTSPTYFTYLKAECLVTSNIGIKTHIIALDYLGTASLIELPSTLILGGSFPTPSSGTKWVLVKSIENEHQLANVFLVSDGGELIRYSWLSDGGFSKYNISNQNEIVAIDIVDQGSYYDILLTTRNNGSQVWEDDGNEITFVSELPQYYCNDSNDHHFANIDDTDVSEVALVVHNSLIFFTPEGTIIESHSFPEVIMTVKNWKVDPTMKVAFVAILIDGTIAVADPSDRISSQNGQAASEMLISPSDQVQNDSESSSGNVVSKTLAIELMFPIFLIIFSSQTFFWVVRKRRQNTNNRRRFQQ